MARRQIPPRGPAGRWADLMHRLTEQFRLGRFFGRERGEPAEPSRPRLHTPEEIVEAARQHAQQMPQAPAQRWRWGFVCVWYDRESGRRIGEWRWNIETSSGTNYDQAYSQARRNSARTMPPCVQREANRGTPLRLSCRRVGGPLLI